VRKAGSNVNFVTDDTKIILALTNEAANPNLIAKYEAKPG